MLLSTYHLVNIRFDFLRLTDLLQQAPTGTYIKSLRTSISSFNKRQSINGTTV